MNYLRSSASNLASLAGFSATKKLNRSTENEKKEESLLEDSEDDHSETEQEQQNRIEMEQNQRNQIEMEQNQQKNQIEMEQNQQDQEIQEQDNNEIILASTDQKVMFTKLVRNIDFFHARGRKYEEAYFYRNPHLGDGFAFHTLGHFFYNFVVNNRLKHPRNGRYWQMNPEDWNDYLSRLVDGEATQDESSEGEIVSKMVKLHLPTTSKLAPEPSNNQTTQVEIVTAHVHQNRPQQTEPEAQQNTPATGRNQKLTYNKVLPKEQKEVTKVRQQITQNRAIRVTSPSPEPISEQNLMKPRTFDPDTTDYYDIRESTMQQLINSHNEQVRVAEMDKEITIDNLNDNTKGLKQWFKKYEFLTEMAGWNDARKGRKLPGFLREEALGIWKRLDSEKIYNYGYAKTEILKKLDNVERRAAAKMEYLNGTQSVAESAKDFARRLKHLYNAAGGDLNDIKGEEMSEAFLITILERGLQPDLAKLTLTRNLKSWEEAMEFMKKLEAIPTQEGHQLGIMSITEESKGKTGTGNVDTLDSMSVPHCSFCKKLHHTKAECRKWMAAQTVGQSDFPLGDSHGRKQFNNRINSQDVRKSNYNNRGYNSSAQRPNQTVESDRNQGSSNNQQQ